MWSGLICQWPSQKQLQKVVKPLDFHVRFPSFDLHVKFPGFTFLTEIVEFFHPNIKSQPGKSYVPSILNEVMDNFNPAAAEMIPRSLHVTIWGLRTSIYVLRYIRYRNFG